MVGAAAAAAVVVVVEVEEEAVAATVDDGRDFISFSEVNESSESVGKLN